MQRASKTIISRIQNRLGLRQNLPQPLRPGEVALTGDTRQVWIGNEDLAPHGVRTYDRSLDTIGLTNPVLAENIVILSFAESLDASQVQELVDWLSSENRRLFPAVAPGAINPVINYNQTRQVIHTGGNQVWFGLRPAEIEFAAAVDATWLTDPAAAVTTVFAEDTPTELPGLASAITASQAFPVNAGTGELDWLGQPGLFRVLLFADEQYQSRAAGAAATLINICSTNSATPNEYVTTLSNIEIGTIDEFEQLIDIPPDVLYANPFLADLGPTGGTEVSTGFQFNTAVSDTVFLEYALSSATQAAVGTLRITVFDDSAVVFDDRVESSDDFDVFLDASGSGGVLDIRYSNDTADTVRFSFVVKRWSSVQ